MKFDPSGWLASPAIRRRAHADEIGNAHMIQYLGHGIANPGHRDADGARFHVPAVSTWPESGTACASQRRQRSIDHANDLTNSYLVRRASKHVAASGSLLAENNAPPAEVAQNRIKEFLRDGVHCGNFDRLQPGPRRERGKAYQSLQAVLSLCGQHAVQTRVMNRLVI